METHFKRSERLVLLDALLTSLLVLLGHHLVARVERQWDNVFRDSRHKISHH